MNTPVRPNIERLKENYRGHDVPAAVNWIEHLEAQLQECRSLLAEEVARIREHEPDAIDSVWYSRAVKSINESGAGQ